MKQLSNKQRKFLEYLRDDLYSLGWDSTIDSILIDDEYEVDDVYCIIEDFRKLRDSKTSGAVHGAYGDDLRGFGKPTKYLKG